jgi:colanic acid/amylovoran biosynthesis glycosyltransferase
MNELFYFTNTFPIGLSANWKMMEIEALAQSGKFTRIHIVPFIKEGTPSIKYSPSERIIVHPPIMTSWPIFTPNRILQLILSKRVISILKLFFSEKAFLNKPRFINFLSATNSAKSVLESKLYKEFILGNEKNITLYFFWGVNAAHVIPFLKKTFKKIVIRFHGYDLFLERNNGYIPFRKDQLKKITVALYVSNQGLNYQQKLFPKIQVCSKVIHLPILTSGITSPSSEGTFRILTCSRIIQLKRLDLLIEAFVLLNCDKKIHWTHIGDGELSNEIKEKASLFLNHINYKFTGWLSPIEVNNYYNSHAIDLFINISTTEGLPTSILEAISHGVPVLATDVGGTHEIIDNACGKLIPPNVNPQILSDEICNFINMEQVQIRTIRKNAVKKYQNHFSNEFINKELILSLT